MSEPTTLPAADQVIAGLPALVDEVAPPEWEDGNGHVNVSHYFTLHLRAAEASIRSLDLHDEYRRDASAGTFSIEQHIRFLGEVLVGDRVSVHVRWIARGRKVAHAVSLVVNHRTGTVVNVLEMLEAHVDLTSRRTSEWGAGAAERLDALIRDHDALAWPAPLSGTIRVRS